MNEFLEDSQRELLLDVLKNHRNKARTNSIYAFPGHAGRMMETTELNNQWRKAERKIEKWFEANPGASVEPFSHTCRLLHPTFHIALYDAGIDALT